MEEYEYSFIVKDIKPYIDYCVENKYRKIKEIKQHRKVFENIHNRKIISRITTENDITIIDFKNTSKNENNLNISNESKSLRINKNNEEFFNSLLNTLDFEQSADNYRIRYIYKKGNVTFEIDDYTSPKMYVVAVEGEKNEVDKVYEELKRLYNKEIIR